MKQKETVPCMTGRPCPWGFQRRDAPFLCLDYLESLSRSHPALPALQLASVSEASVL